MLAGVVSAGRLGGMRVAAALGLAHLEEGLRLSEGSRVAVGSDLGGYRVEALIGHGGMGAVYRAKDLRLGRTVALKLLAEELVGDDRFQERFLAESRLAASIDHPGIVPIFEADDADGLLYIAMRYVDGGDLGALLRREGPLAPDARSLS